MVVESLLALPRWMYLGVFAGALSSVCVAATFFVVSRVYSDTREVGSSSAGDERRLVEIRRYLEVIEEPYREDETVDGTSVAFYLPDRDVAITFDPRTFYALEPSTTRPVLVEHEMPGLHLGHRLPFDTPDIGFGDDTDDEIASTDAAFAVLGLSAGADESTIRRAYREKLKQVHPDHGGDREEFRKVREAYDTARADRSS